MYMSTKEELAEANTLIQRGTSRLHWTGTCALCSYDLQKISDATFWLVHMRIHSSTYYDRIVRCHNVLTYASEGFTQAQL